MSARDQFVGLVCGVAYVLERSKLGFVRFRAGAIWLSVLAAAYTVFRAWRYGFAAAHAAIIAGCLLLVAVLLWAHRQRYLVFRAEPRALGQNIPPLTAEEKLFLRGSGAFEVSDMRRYLVQVPVVFWTTQLAEHILAAKVRAFNILGIGVPSDERGWWYIFVEPRRVRDIVPGRLYFGLRNRPALMVMYDGAKASEAIYLSADADDLVDRLLAEIRATAQAASSRREVSTPDHT